jgi:hypothetical protein
MTWPVVGQPLPRASDAYSEAVKWTDWILSDEHHGSDWRAVFGMVDPEAIWAVLTEAIVTAPIITIREAAGGGLSCGVAVSLTLNDRTAMVRSAWHYAAENDAPRLVTAFPTT